MAEKIEESIGISESEAQEKRKLDEFLDWCHEFEHQIPLVEAFMAASRLHILLCDLGMPERMIQSADRIAERLFKKARALKG